MHFTNPAGNPEVSRINKGWRGRLADKLLPGPRKIPDEARIEIGRFNDSLSILIEQDGETWSGTISEENAIKLANIVQRWMDGSPSDRTTARIW